MADVHQAGGSGTRRVELDVHGRASLDGVWDFFPGDHAHASLDALQPEPIVVPGLWEAQGHLELDGVAWYRTRADVDDPAGFWTLRFAAVMDIADVFLNGDMIGRHEHAFTPFELDVTGLLRHGTNVIDVRVTDPSVDDPEHIRLVHGKQGWANHVFPSRPSLYMTYGGIWQPVTIRRHGPVTTRDVFVNADANDLTVTVELLNHSSVPASIVLGVRTVNLLYEAPFDLAPHEVKTVVAHLGMTPAPHWSPESPVLHEALIDVQVDGVLSDRRRLRFGLRTITVEGTQIFVDDEPFRMKSVLVQGFRADELYAEGTREQIAEEVLAAKAMGFNMLRLHIKAFDPRYLDICDELGIFVEADLPVAEPIAHGELGDGTPLSRRAVDAVSEQVRRDRNHPSIILWSAMNELGLDGVGARESDEYEQFARTMYAAVEALDPTRPIIENEWVEPDPDRVFCSPILTAHWYGRLHAEYLEKLDRESRRWAGTGRPFFVSEFGDWGLPAMPELEDAPFWDTREIYAAGLASTLWPSTIARFITETQRYQGLSDRLQTEVFRRHPHIGGYCLTELTDVPHELNGLLDLHRRPKPIAVEEVTRANQTVLPMLKLDSLVVESGGLIRAAVHVSNDGPALEHVEVQVRFGDSVTKAVQPLRRWNGTKSDAGAGDGRFTESATALHVGRLDGYHAAAVGELIIEAPVVSGSHDLRVALRSRGEDVTENRYPIHVVNVATLRASVDVIGGGPTAAAFAAMGDAAGPGSVAVVAEGALDADTGRSAREILASGAPVIVLAQHPEAAGHYPVEIELAAVETAWGSSVFHFTTDSGALPCLPRRNVLVVEETTVQAASVAVRIGAAAFPDEPVVIAYKPVPGAITGTVVGMHRVGPGRLIICQYRVVDRALAGDAVARALLSDLVAWAAEPRAATTARTIKSVSGGSVTYYDYPVHASAGHG